MEPAYAAAWADVAGGDAESLEGVHFSEVLRRRARRLSTPQGRGRKRKAPPAQASATPQRQVTRTAQVYRIPWMAQPGKQKLAVESVSWPRYVDGRFTDAEAAVGPSMLELTEEEYRSLQVVVLRTDVRAERWAGAGHFLNWKKVGVSRAYYKDKLVCEGSMPTQRAAAALRYLEAHSHYFRYHREQQRQRLQSHSSLNLSSYALFILERGIECAMFPHLYPRTEFTDTALWNHYRATAEVDDAKSRLCSIGYSWTRKVLSSVRVYGEHRDLAFFLYEVDLANRYFNAHARAKRMGLTGDVMARDSQSSSGYWEITQDALSDVVRVMLGRCYDEVGYPQLDSHVRSLCGQVWLCAFPNLFITIAPAEWKFPRQP